MSRYSSNFEFSSDMTKKLIFGHLASLGPHKRRPSGHWVLYGSPLKGLRSFFTLTPIEKFRRGPKSNFWPLWDTPVRDNVRQRQTDRKTDRKRDRQKESERKPYRLRNPQDAPCVRWNPFHPSRIACRERVTRRSRSGFPGWRTEWCQIASPWNLSTHLPRGRRLARRRRRWRHWKKGWCMLR